MLRSLAECLSSSTASLFFILFLSLLGAFCLDSLKPLQELYLITQATGSSFDTCRLKIVEHCAFTNMSTNQALATIRCWAIKTTEVVCHRAVQSAQHPLTRNAAIASAALGLVFWVNRALNSLSLNNWTMAKRWDNERELVLITGGCSGIGKEIATSLVKKGIRVVVLDIQDPTFTHGK